MIQNLPQKIKIVEVGPRDGLQNEPVFISTEDKFVFIQKLIESGLTNIEVTSFVKSSSIPQMEDAENLYDLLRKNLSHKVTMLSLVPNMRGFDRAIKQDVSHIALFSSTSNAFNKKNINCTIDESFDRMRSVSIKASQRNVKIRAYVSTAFGCPYIGIISFDILKSVIERFIQFGAYEISLGDTIGVATPIQVENIIIELKKYFDISQLALHFHDTRGMAIANILVSLQQGITIFDSSAGGLGGCPYAKGAAGNVATEDLVYLCNSLGIETGVDIKKLSQASSFILSKLNKETTSKYLRAYLASGK